MISKIKVLAGANIKANMIYKINFLMNTISTLVLFIVHYNLWSTIYKVKGVNEIGGFTLTNMIIYVAIARVVNVFINSINLEGKVAGEIKNGTFSVYLVKPMNHLLYNISSRLGNMIIQLLVSLITFILIFIFVFKSFSGIPSVLTIVIIIFSAIAGMFINTLIGYICALVALWFEQVNVMFIFKGLLLSFISGVLIPIQFFPNGLRQALRYLPFNYLIAFTIDIYLGKVKGVKIIYGFGIQLFWIFLLLLIIRIMWRKGIKKYTSTGG